MSCRDHLHSTSLHCPGVGVKSFHCNMLRPQRRGDGGGGGGGGSLGPGREGLGGDEAGCAGRTGLGATAPPGNGNQSDGPAPRDGGGNGGATGGAGGIGDFAVWGTSPVESVEVPRSLKRMILPPSRSRSPLLSTAGPRSRCALSSVPIRVLRSSTTKAPSPRRVMSACSPSTSRDAGPKSGNGR